MKPWRFKTDSIGDGDRIEVVGGQVHHAVTVLRLARGAEVCVFDGRGDEAFGIIEAVDSAGNMTVRITRRLARTQRQGPLLTIATAIPKGERADWLIEKCAELGAERVIPLRCARAQVIPGEGKIDRWRRKVVEAAKQSGQRWTMRVESPRALLDAVQEAIARGPAYFGDPRGDAPGLLDELGMWHSRPRLWAAGCVTLFVGPEGGFDDEEVAALQAAGVKPVRLAESVLRIETAAVAAVSIWAAWCLQARGRDF